MRNNEDINLTKNGKFYNVKKATLLLVSEFFNSYGLKRRAYYKSATGIFFETFQYVKKEHSIESYQDLTVEQNIHKETIVEEKSFKTIQSLFEISEKGNTIPIDFGVNCHCIYRGGQPLSLLKVVNKPIEFNQVVEV